MRINVPFLLGREEIMLDNKAAISQVCNRRILLTGAAGSIGRELTKQILLCKPSHVCLIDQSELGVHKLRSRFGKIPGVEIVLGNITNQKRMHAIFSRARPDIVFHSAAYKHVYLMEDYPYEAITNNIFGTKIIADLALNFKVEKFIHISTDKAVNPAGAMGQSKQLSEKYVQSLNTGNTEFIITRFGNVLGSTGSVYHTFKSRIAKGKNLTVTDPKATRYFMTRYEASQLVLNAAAIGNQGELLVFNMGKPVLIADLAERMIETLGNGKAMKIEFKRLAAGEKLHENLINHDEEIISANHSHITILRLPSVCQIQMGETIASLEKAIDKSYEYGFQQTLKSVLKEEAKKYSSVDQFV